MDNAKGQKKYTRPSIALKHKKVLDNLVENGGNMSKAIRDTGLYSDTMIKTPSKIMDSKSWNEVMEAYISDDDLATKHKELLNATRLDHMVFPLGAKDEDERLELIALAQVKAEKEGKDFKVPDIMTDQDIRQMLLDVNCKVRRIVHGETARHVYFWANDNKSRKDAIEMGYKLKGRFATGDEMTPRQGGNTYNFIFSAPVQEQVKAMEDNIKSLLIKKHESD